MAATAKTEDLEDHEEAGCQAHRQDREGRCQHQALGRCSPRDEGHEGEGRLGPQVLQGREGREGRIGCEAQEGREGEGRAEGEGSEGPRREGEGCSQGQGCPQGEGCQGCEGRKGCEAPQGRQGEGSQGSRRQGEGCSQGRRLPARHVRPRSKTALRRLAHAFGRFPPRCRGGCRSKQFQGYGIARRSINNDRW